MFRIPILAFILVVILGCGQSPAPNSNAGKTQWVDPTKLLPGPIQHAQLSEQQLSRIKALQETFAEVDPQPLEKWIDDFKRDQNPDAELEVYESMASAYTTYCSTRKLSLEEKNEVYSIVLMRSAATDGEVLTHINARFLQESEVKEVLKGYSDSPKPIKIIKSPP